MRPQSSSGGWEAPCPSIAAVSTMLIDLTPAPWTAGEVALDLRALVRVDGVERVRAEELLRLRMSELPGHDPPIPDSASSPRIRRRPTRIRLLTVPSGSSRMAATSRYVRPPK